jgi:hypothetical protein
MLPAASYNRLLQSISFIINRYSNLPIVSRIQIYDSLQNYLLDQEFRIQTLESRVKILEFKQLQSCMQNCGNQTALTIVKEKDKSLMKL